jgi:hypothetical protein
MRKITAIVMIGIMMLGSFVPHAGAVPKPEYGAEEAEKVGKCSLSQKTKGELWEFKATNGEWVTLCCPVGQYPTGRMGVKDQRCARPGPARCGVGETVRVVCLTSPPTLQCCKPGQIVLCSQSVSERRCVNPAEVLPGVLLPQNDL